MRQEWRVNAEFENKPKDKLCLHKRLSAVGGQSNVEKSLKKQIQLPDHYKSTNEVSSDLHSTG